MDTSTYYAATPDTCFALVSLWLSVVKNLKEWFEHETSKHPTGGVYASLLIPGLMSLATQIGVESSLIWRRVFLTAAIAVVTLSSKLIKSTHQTNPNRAFSRNSWVVPVLYGSVLFFAVFSGLADMLDYTPCNWKVFCFAG